MGILIPKRGKLAVKQNIYTLIHKVRRFFHKVIHYFKGSYTHQKNQKVNQKKPFLSRYPRYYY
jgi:hypothetical protein